MSFLDPQNPGIGGLEELTDNEQTFVQNLSSLSYEQGDILYYNSGSLTRLPLGSASQVLKVNAGGTAPEWGTGGGGTLDGSGTSNELVYWVDSDTLGTLAVATYPSLTELSYVKGVSSSIQTQIGTKAPSTSPTFATSITGSYLTASEILITDSSKNIVSAAVATYPSLTELTYLKGVTSSLQTQIGAKLSLSGGTMSGPITLGENTSIALDPAGSADGKYSGITVTGIAGYTQAFGDLVYLAVADSRWEAADADAVGTAGTVILAMVVSAGTDGNACTLLLQGIIRADAKFPALTVGAPVYVGETAGAIQVAIPTGADNVIRVVGFALTADEIYFNPSSDHQLTVA